MDGYGVLPGACSKRRDDEESRGFDLGHNN